MGIHPGGDSCSDIGSSACSRRPFITVEDAVDSIMMSALNKVGWCRLIEVDPG